MFAGVVAQFNNIYLAMNFDDYADDDSIVFNIEFFGTKFSFDILKE